MSHNEVGLWTKAVKSFVYIYACIVFVLNTIKYYNLL